MATEKDRDYSQVPIPVIDISHLIYSDGVGITIAVGCSTVPAIVDILEKNEIKDCFCLRQD